MHIENQTSDQDSIKICLYKVEDAVMIIPVGAGVFTVARGVTHEWNAPGSEGLPEYHIKVFHASFIDGLLCDLNHAPASGHFIVRGGGGSYSISPVHERS